MKFIHSKKLKLLGAILSPSLLMACVSDKRSKDEQYIPVNPVITKHVPEVTPQLPIAATFALQDNPKIVAAYQQFRRNGSAKTIQGDGFITYPFDPYSKPIIACAPLNLCIIQLQQGEVINDISLGDGAHWLVSTALIGSAENGSYQINIKPKQFELATDITIATNKRSYNLRLVSQNDIAAEVVNFYYPEESLHDAIAQANRQFVKSQQSIEDATHINLSSLNFNYQVQGDKPSWRPIRIFDDGHKSYIQMPQVVQNFELPVLYLVRNNEKQLVNYRYHEPYYIIDGLFEKAYLIAGKGTKQTRVIIVNPKKFA